MGFIIFGKCLGALNCSLKTILNFFLFLFLYLNHVIQILIYIGKAGNSVCFECQFLKSHPTDTFYPLVAWLSVSCSSLENKVREESW